MQAKRRRRSLPDYTYTRYISLGLTAMDAQAKQVKNTHINKQIFQNEFAKKLTRLSHSNNNNNTTATTTTATSATTTTATINVRDKLLDTLLFRSCSRCHAPLTRGGRRAKLVYNLFVCFCFCLFFILPLALYVHTSSSSSS